MNRHQRRAAAKREYQAGVRAMAKEANGIVKITTVRPKDYLALLSDMLMGRTDCIPLIGTVAELIARFQKAQDDGSPLLCAACPAELKPGFAIVVATSADAMPKNRLGVGVCTTCGPDLPSIEAAALKGLQGIWPDLRPINVHPEAGHA